jgi:SNF2 family DNA or RNA helicase
MLHISHLTKSVVLPFEARYGQLFPHGTIIEFEGVKMLVIPHGIDETRLLRNLQLPCPSPIEEHYDFPSADGTRPFAKQVITCELMTMAGRCYVLNSMGTGKTKAAIWSFHYLRSIGAVGRMLVVAPLSTLAFTWQREILNTIPGFKVAVLTGTADRRKRLLASDCDIYIINHDGLQVVRKELDRRTDIDVFCFDEVAAYRNARAERSKLARFLSKGRKYVWGMTGSPTPTAPTDAYGLAKLITPDTAPWSWTGFRHETMTMVNQFKWVPKRDAAKVVAATLQPSVRFQLDDIVELPALYERDLRVEMGPRQQATYRMLKDHAGVMLKEGTITAANGGVVYSKLLQTSIGWVYGDDGKVFELDNGNRITALLDIIDSVIDATDERRKVIVFSPFISSMQGIERVLAKEKIDYASVNGSTPAGKRAQIFTEFQNSPRYKVLNAHPECMSHGLTLTAADTIIWFGPVTKLEVFEQANARIRRVGQTRKQQVIRMLGSEAERLAYRRLAQRADLQDNVLDLIAELTGADE